MLSKENNRTRPHDISENLAFQPKAWAIGLKSTNNLIGFREQSPLFLFLFHFQGSSTPVGALQTVFGHPPYSRDSPLTAPVAIGTVFVSFNVSKVASPHLISPHLYLVLSV